jgi:hypothetical protein
MIGLYLASNRGYFMLKVEGKSLFKLLKKRFQQLKKNKCGLSISMGRQLKVNSHPLQIIFTHYLSIGTTFYPL